MTAKLERHELDRIITNHYAGHYGQFQNDIDILLTHIEFLHNRKMSLLEQIHALENPTYPRKRMNNVNASR